MTYEEKLAQSINAGIELKQIRVNGYSINYAVCGQGEPLLLIHGANIGWGMWYKNIGELAKHFRVYAIDLPGAGGSTKIDYRYVDLEKIYTDTVAEFIRTMELDGLSIMAHSFGGWIAVRLALRNSSRIKKLVLVCSSGLSKSLLPKEMFLSFYFIANFLSKTVLKPTKKKMYQFLSAAFYNRNILEILFVDYFYESIFRSQLSHPALFFNSLTQPFNFKSELNISNDVSTLTLPVLLIWGEKDSIVPLNRSKSAFDLFRFGEVRLFKDIGHVPPIEDGVTFNSITYNFLK